MDRMAKSRTHGSLQPLHGLPRTHLDEIRQEGGVGCMHKTLFPANEGKLKSLVVERISILPPVTSPHLGDRTILASWAYEPAK